MDGGSGIGGWGIGGIGELERNLSMLFWKERPKRPARLLRLGTDLRLVAAEGVRRAAGPDVASSMPCSGVNEAEGSREANGESGSATTRRVMTEGGGIAPSCDGCVMWSVGGRTWAEARAGCEIERRPAGCEMDERQAGWDTEERLARSGSEGESSMDDRTHGGTPAFDLDERFPESTPQTFERVLSLARGSLLLSTGSSCGLGAAGRGGAGGSDTSGGSSASARAMRCDDLGQETIESEALRMGSSSTPKSRKGERLCWRMMAALTSELRVVPSLIISSALRRLLTRRLEDRQGCQHRRC